MRRESEREFHKQFLDATNLGKKLHDDDFELSRPRITGRQTHRANVATSNTEDYYRISIYDEFLSHVVAEMEARFIDNPAHKLAIGLLYLLPTKCVSLPCDVIVPSELEEAVRFFSLDLPNPVMFSTEYNDWVRKWKSSSSAAPASSSSSSNTLPERLIDSFKLCSPIQYPNLHVVFRIALTLPITSCQSERSFSQLKLVKTARRSAMTETRLSGLALMKLNRERCNRLLSDGRITEMVKRFVQMHPRRIKLPFMLNDN